jgi:hypothetical protein
VEITQQPEGVTVKTATDTLHLTVCGATSIEHRIYRGADGHFDLYEDQGDTYNYEKGEHFLIPSTGTNPRRASSSARAPVVIPACQQGASSTVSL